MKNEVKLVNFNNISYLREGSNKQKKCYKILTKTNIFNILKDYMPILVGTIPLNIDIESSDLDIVCQVDDFEIFENTLFDNFSKYKYFRIEHKEKNITVCNFIVESMEIEIYASNEQSHKTNGYRHMIIEYKLLNLYGEKFRESIIELKKEGIKTEPAFAKLLNLNGNPYEELLKCEGYLLDKTY
ncbi:hypothetical protein SDC9_135563 [bioreactor metagenome]|uniref:Uncharacterized protein n=1 Tax=bioreactor metagenome TaxID=1076179 RepID=A0A645DGP8_9ZZZZ